MGYHADKELLRHVARGIGQHRSEQGRHSNRALALAGLLPKPVTG